jgi:hypothetical protein
MRTKWASCLIPGFVLAANTCGAAQSSRAVPKGELGTITIRVYDYTHAKPRVLIEAERAAATILEKSGVEAVWVDCLKDDASPSVPACVASADPTNLTLRILPDSMSNRLRQVHGDALGFAMLAEPLNCDAWIFYGRVEEFSLKQQLTFESLLGGVIAHELGHLLLGENVHANAGLMHGHWSRRELLGLEFARLPFSDSESLKIQSGVVARHKLASVGSSRDVLLELGSAVN